MIQAMIWDMDGVIVDTTEVHFWSWVLALNEHGRNMTRQEFLNSFGRNNFSTIQIMFGTLPIEEVMSISDRKESLFRENLAGRVELYPGVMEWLEYASSKNLPCAVASSAPFENVQAIIQHFELQPYFAALESGFRLPSKPDPAVFLAAASRMQVLPQDCLVLEDAPAGIEAANRAGMHSLALLTTRQRSEFPPADHFSHQLSDLRPEQFIEMFNNR